MSGRPYEFDWNEPDPCEDCRGCREHEPDYRVDYCLRCTPEALEKIRVREERRRVPDHEKTALDRAYEKRTATISGTLDIDSLTDILKECYSQHRWKGTYSQEQLLKELHNFEKRKQRLRGGKFPKKDDIVKRVPALRGMKMTSLYDELYRNPPFFALIKKDESLG